MRKLLFLLVTLTVLWSGYWFVGSSMIRSTATKLLAAQAATGVTAETSSLSVAGFPNRFDLTAEGIRFSDPASGVGWQAPFAQIFAMTWKPWHIIAALPPEQTVTLPGQEVTVTSEGLRSSVRARPAASLPLAMAIVESGPLSATSSLGWTFAAQKAVLSLGAASATPNGYDITADIADLAPDPALLQLIAPEGGLAATISEIRLRANATLTAPLDRHAGETQPRLAILALSDLAVTWGEVRLTAEGSIGPDDQGLAAGRINFTITNWRTILPILVASGTVRPQLARTAETMLEGLARQTGDPEVLKIPLTMQDGWMSFGPIPLGPAPVLLPPTG
jgi:hypothetical protein